MGIPETRTRRAFTGGLIIKIPGEEKIKKADLLAERLRSVFREQNVRILRSVKQAEVRIVNLDESVEADDIVAEFAKLSGTQEEDIKVAPIRFGRSGFGSTVVRCPVECANRMADRCRWGGCPLG